MTRCCLRPAKASGYSLLEISVSLLLFGLVLLLSANTLVGLMAHRNVFQDRSQAYQLAHNLMETLLALPETEAKALDVSASSEWTGHHRYDVTATWRPYSNPRFEILTVEYAQHGQPLIHLVTLTPHHSS